MSYYVKKIRKEQNREIKVLKGTHKQIITNTKRLEKEIKKGLWYVDLQPYAYHSFTWNDYIMATKYNKGKVVIKSWNNFAICDRNGNTLFEYLHIREITKRFKEEYDNLQHKYRDVMKDIDEIIAHLKEMGELE